MRNKEKKVQSRIMIQRRFNHQKKNKILKRNSLLDKLLCKSRPGGLLNSLELRHLRI